MPDLGTKHECFSCGARFYDLGKSEPVCPKCGANQKNAKKSDVTSESAAAKRKRREEVHRPVDETPEDVPQAAADDDFHDDEIETPEGVEEEELEVDLEE